MTDNFDRSPVLVLVGEKDEAVDARALRGLFAADRAGREVEILPGIDHFAVFRDESVLDRVATWLRDLQARSQ